MTTYPTLKIVKGNRSIDLNDRVNFYLRTDLVPPETNQATQIATGSALNMAGGRVVARKPQTRSWTFSVRVVGTTDADIINQLRGVKALLSQAGDANEPVKIQYKPNSDTPEPLWGQFGALLNYEVLSGRITIGPDYMRGARRAKAVTATFELTIQPYALGKQQRMCTATGGIIEDTIGTVDGRSRGLIVPEATVNYVTNPIFENDTAGWATTGAGATLARITTDRYVGSACALVFKPAGVAGGIYDVHTTSTGGSWTASAALKAYTAYDVGRVVSLYVQINYSDATSDTTITNVTLSSNWQIVSATRVANGAKTVSAVLVFARDVAGTAVNHYFLVDAVQLENKAYATPLAYGDLLGCTWASTAHASTTTRTAAACKISTANDTLKIGAWTIRVAVKMAYASTDTAARYIFDGSDGTATNGPLLYVASGHFILGYATVAVDSGALTYAAGATYVLHAVCSGSTITLYVNGVAAATSAAFAATALGAALFIGSSYASADHSNVTTLGRATFDTALTAAQVAADYTNAAAVIADGARLESTPWLWTKDGDDIVDNCNDSTRDNWFVVGGVGGNAQTPIRLHATPTALEPNGVWLANNHAAVFVKPDPLFIDYNTNADATCSGGGYGSGAISTTGASRAVSALSSEEYKRLLAGKRAIVFARVEVSAGTLSIKARVLSGSTVMYESDWVTTSAVAAVFQLYKTPEIRLIEMPLDAFGVVGSPQIQLFCKSDTGTPTVNIDYACVLAGDVVEYLARHSASAKMMIFETGAIGTDSSDAFTENMPTTGHVPLSVYPDEFNIFMLQMGYVGGSNTVADTFTIGALYVTPRHELL